MSAEPIVASYNDLLRQGWSPPKKPIEQGAHYPSAERVLLEKDDIVLGHVYRVYDDWSEWYGNDHPVRWTRYHLEQVVLFRLIPIP